MLIDQTGRPVRVTYRFSRYGTRDQVECDTVEQALTFAYWDVEETTAYPLAILVDGEVAYDEDALVADRLKRDGVNPD